MTTTNKSNERPLFKQTEAQREFCRMASGGATRVMAFGGSRSGKTFEIVREIVTIALVAGGRHAIFRRNFNAVKTSILLDTIPKVLKLCFPGVKANVNKSDFFVSFPTSNAEIWILGLDDKERVEKILGKEFATLYFNECSEISYHAVETALTRLSEKNPNIKKNIAFFDCNPTVKSHWAYKMFVEKKNPVSNVLWPNPEDYVSMKMNPTDNRENLPDGYVEQTLATFSEKKRERFLYGNWTDENENALWKPTMVDPFRTTFREINVDEFDKIVVGVDPAVTSAENSDLTGIVVVGSRLVDAGEKVPPVRHFYVLEDATLRGTPEQWARAVSVCYNKWKADKIVAEVNNGGDLVASTIRNVDISLPVKTVRATRGKILRAEPAAALYERGLVHHVGEFIDLEEQMYSFTGSDASEKSPDRLDALVWALAEAVVERTKITTGELYFD